MALETGDFLDDLVQTNPVKATDPVTEGADHLQLLKKVLQQTFPNLDAAMTLTPAQLNNAAIKNAVQTISGAWTFSDIVTVTDTTESTSPTTGSIHTAGGLGVAKRLHVGGTFTSRGIDDNATVEVLQLTDSVVDVHNSLVVGGVLSVDDTTDSTSGITGSIHTDGGLGVAKNIFLGGRLIVTGSFSAPSAGQGVIAAASVLGLELAGSGSTHDITLLNKNSFGVIQVPTGTKHVEFAGKIIGNDTTDSTSTLTGAIQTDGGLGVVKNVVVGGKMIIGDTSFADNDSLLQLTTSNSGVTTLSGNADDMLIESSGNTGLTIATGTTSLASIAFGHSGDPDIVRIEIQHAADANDSTISFRTNNITRVQISGNGGLATGNIVTTGAISATGDITAFA